MQLTLRTKPEITYLVLRYGTSEKSADKFLQRGIFGKYEAIRSPSAARLGDCSTFSVSKFGAAGEVASFQVAMIKDVCIEAVRNWCHY